MRLLTLLVLRLMAVVLFCLAVAIGCSIFDAHRSIESDVAATSARVNQHLLWRDGMARGTLLPLPEWKSLATQSIISPGVCVTFAPPDTDRDTLCSQVEVLGQPAPRWFATAYLAVLGSHEPVTKLLSVRDTAAGLVATSVDPDAALRRAWREISTVVEVAMIMGGGIAFLAAIMIGHALLPARAIVDALRKLEEGHLSLRLSKFKSTEFNHIANAVNRLAATLRQTNSERRALTNRLFQVQEEERRALARDLHDEFGDMSEPIFEHGYWGSMRDRLPVSQNDTMEPSGQLTVVQGHPQAGGRVVISGHQNLTLIRSGEDWSRTEGEERRTWYEDIEPVLNQGMDYLRDDGLEVGCYTNRYCHHIDENGNPQEKGFGVSLWNSLAALEHWGESHATHLQIFVTFMRNVKKFKELTLYHEVSVFDASNQYFEYINCHPKTGLLRAV